MIIYQMLYTILKIEKNFNVDNECQAGKETFTNNFNNLGQLS